MRCFDLFLETIHTATEARIGGAVQSGRRRNYDAEPVISLIALLNTHRNHWNLRSKSHVRFRFAIASEVFTKIFCELYQLHLNSNTLTRAYIDTRYE